MTKDDNHLIKELITNSLDAEVSPTAIVLIETAKIDFEKSGNALHVWFAYKTAREAGYRPIPEWILEYLDRVSENLYASSFPGPFPKNPASAALEALELKRSGKSGRGNPFKDFFQTEHFEMAAKVLELLQAGEKKYIAYEIVAQEYKKSEATVRRAWKRYGYFYQTKYVIK